MIDTSKQYTYNGKPVRIYADGSDTHQSQIHAAINYGDGWHHSKFKESDLVEVWQPKAERISMTKEDMRNKMYQLGDDVVAIDALWDEFFDSNVVIPRGENRHPDSDLLHMAVEDNSIVLECSNTLNPWEDVSSFHKFSFRIKPSEPVLEYLWLDLRTPLEYGLPTTKYMTNDEADNFFGCNRTNIIRVNETKRVRQ